MMDAGRHPNIELLTYSELQDLSGTAGDFTARIFRKPRYVDPDQCTACGDCATECPIVRHSEFNVGLGVRKAIYQEFPQAVPSAYILSEEDCLRRVPIACAKCIKACKMGCIDHDDPGEFVERKVGSVIVSTGIDYYDPREASEYGYGRFQNVVTSFELERLLSAGGPTKGELITITGHKTPKSIALINCVGSRNERHDLNYCSRICCMNAIKAALLIREHYPESDIYLFYIDIRAFGKGFEEFYQRAIDEGIKFIKGKPSKIVEDPQTGNPILYVENIGEKRSQQLQVDLAVLSSALIPPDDLSGTAQALDIERDRYGFFKPLDATANPLESTRPGVYLAGCASAPKDITDAIAEASGAAAKAALHIQPLAAALEKEAALAENGESDEPEIMVTEPLVESLSDGPRVGVFICHCGLNIAGIVDMAAVREASRKLPGVAYVEDTLFACSDSTQRYLQDVIKNHRLNRLVVAACTPRTHEPVFRESLKAAGLNPYLLEMANIRDQCSWVHQKSGSAATEKAVDLIRMAVSRAVALEPLQTREMKLNRDVLVIGGGVAGMQAAVDISRQGFSTTLVESAASLGGRTAELTSLYPSGISGSSLVKRLEKQLNDADVTILTDTQVQDISGFIGNFDVTWKTDGDQDSAKGGLRVGAIVLAIGAGLYEPGAEYGSNRWANVITNMDLERLLAGKSLRIDRKAVKSAAFIQCVGSRDPKTNPACSRYCCQAAIRQALELRKRGVDVTIFYRDIRVYSMGAEEMYRRAREQGVLFIQYDPEKKPEVKGNKRAERVGWLHPELGETMHLPVDAVILSVGLTPRVHDHAHLADLMKIPRTMDGFYMELHPKFGPVETTTDGVYITGCAQSPKDIGDSLAQSAAVAGKAAALLTGGTAILEPITSTIRSEFCRACGSCVDVCEFNAISIVDMDGSRHALVNEVLCKGCGTCASICPSGAIDIRHFRDEQIGTVLEALLANDPFDESVPATKE